MKKKKLKNIGPLYYELLPHVKNSIKINIYGPDKVTMVFSKEINGTKKDAEKWAQALIAASNNRELEGHFGLWSQ